MLRSNSAVLFLALWFVTLNAKGVTADTTRSITYFNKILTGALVGSPSSGVGFSASVINGIRWKKTSIGLGVGMDHFEQWKTIPIFIDASYELLHWKKTSAVAGVNFGYALPRHKDSENDFLRYDEEGGSVVHPFISYIIRADAWRIYITSGFKFQEIKYAEYPRWAVGRPVYSNDVKRDINRFSLSIGFGWH